MISDDLPDEVSMFLVNCIDSVEQLRVLLLLQAQPERTWSIQELTIEIRSAESSIAKRIEDLYARKVLERRPELGNRHGFSPASAEIRAVIFRLADENQLRPYKVIDAIYSKSSPALQAFADAFKFRGDKS